MSHCLNRLTRPLCLVRLEDDSVHSFPSLPIPRSTSFYLYPFRDHGANPVLPHDASSSGRELLHVLALLFHATDASSFFARAGPTSAQEACSTTSSQDRLSTYCFLRALRFAATPAARESLRPLHPPLFQATDGSPSQTSPLPSTFARPPPPPRNQFSSPREPFGLLHAPEPERPPPSDVVVGVPVGRPPLASSVSRLRSPLFSPLSR